MKVPWSIRWWRIAGVLCVVTLFGLFAGGGFLFATGAYTLLQQLMFVGGVALLLLLVIFVYLKMTDKLRQLLIQAAWAEVKEFNSLYERSPIAYLTVTTNGYIKRANPSAVRLLGETLETILERNWYEYIDQARTDKSVDIVAGKVQGGVTVRDMKLPIITRVRESRWVLVNLFTTNNQAERLVELFDITEQHAVDTAKSEFVALATHQLRTPIAAIRWNTELLERTLGQSATDKQRQYLDKINRNIIRTVALIDDFLSVSKLEMGTFAAEPEEIIFAEYLEQIKAEFEERISKKQIQFQYQLPTPTLRVQADRRLFHIIVSNLVSNAVKYTPVGGRVTVVVELVEGRDVLLHVQDSGIGIPELEQAQLFTKFYRASNATKTETEGTGLGLYVARQSVTLLGGELHFVSTEGVGTTFTVRLPKVVR